MQFTLTYDGPLKAASRGSAAVKHAIRRQLHPQLKNLWTLPPLVHARSVIDPDPEKKESGVAISTIGGREFASVVFDQFHLRAKLHVRMLRREPPGALTHGGDIDNRLKTLLDALHAPRHEQEIPTDWLPTPDEAPLHCLLEDDRQVTRVDVDTVRWLAPGPLDDVRLVIDVEVWTPSPTFWSLSVL
jgi:hypothetical protein